MCCICVVPVPIDRGSVSNKHQYYSLRPSLYRYYFVNVVKLWRCGSAKIYTTVMAQSRAKEYPKRSNNIMIDQNADEEIVKRLNVYPKNAKSLFAPEASPSTGSSGTCSSSSVGK